MAVNELVDKKEAILCCWELSELDKCISHFAIICMIQAHFIVSVALHCRCIEGVAYLHLTKCKMFSAKIAV